MYIINPQTYPFLPSQTIEENQIKKYTLTMEALTDNAISKLLSIQNGMNECFVVDLSRQKKNKKRLSLMISDGDQKFKGFIDLNERTKDVEQLMKKAPRGVLRVRILQHITHFQQNDPTDIEIVDFQVTKERSVKIQANRPVKLQQESFKPINYIPFIPQNKPLHPTPFFPSLLPPNENPLQAVIKENLKNNNNNYFKPLPKLQCKSDEEDTQQERPIPARHDPYQTISQLYEQYYHWKIVVRINDGSYSEFTSKKGKFIKLMTLQLIDREGTIITANLFGENGKTKFSQLKMGGIYRISRGIIKLDEYNKDKRDNQSKYSITISRDTEFSPLDDSLDIPECRNNWLRLNQLTQLTKNEAHYDFIAILVDVQECMEIPKPEKTHILQKIHVGDPSTGLVIEVAIWNHQIQIDEALVGKSILLKKFKLNHYKDTVGLKSSQSSQIVPHPLLSAFEGSCSFHIPKYTANFNTQSVKTLRDVAQQLSNTAFNVPIYSYVDVWVKEMGFDKKWLYEACPSCKKSCTGNNTNRCQKCQGPIDNPNRSFKLQIKLADISGSVTVTSFDGTALIFLKETPMDELFPMSNRELCEYADSYFVYEQYRVNLKSCRDMLGQQIHNLIGKPVPISIAEGVQGNLMRIAALKQEIRQNERRSYF